MKTANVYRRILEFSDVIKGQVSNTVAENSNGVDREKLVEMTREINSTISKGFDSLITSIQKMEQKSAQEEEKNKVTKKTRGKSKK